MNAEIFSVPGATNFGDLLNRVAAVYQGYQARNFPERAQVLAAEIESARPVLIGLQEAVLDYVQLLLSALAERGLHYQVAAEIHGFDIELPSAGGFDLRHTDREVILVRTDMPPGHLQLSNVQTGHFAINCQIPSVAFGPITVRRGWAAVDVWTRGRSFRLISTHLDGDCLSVTSAIQVAQAQELLSGPANSSLPVVLVGDINASPLDPAPSAYQTLTNGGYIDAWHVAGTGNGFTCCQADDLSNPSSLLNTRIDVVLLRGGFTARAVDVMGDDAAMRTLSGLWPSDHAGIVATLEISER